MFGAAEGHHIRSARRPLPHTSDRLTELDDVTGLDEHLDDAAGLVARQIGALGHLLEVRELAANFVEVALRRRVAPRGRVLELALLFAKGIELLARNRALEDGDHGALRDR